MSDDLSSLPPPTSFLNAQNETTPPSSYTFLHSDLSSQPSNLDDASVKADKFAHTRTKRKRTSPKDQKFLEEEYRTNAKPDKTTRDRIVAKVDLTDKEVQIWFQNRRQMTRRKLNTWQPNAITSIIRSSQDPPNESQSSSTDLSSSQESPCNSQSSASNRESESLRFVAHTREEGADSSTLWNNKALEEDETAFYKSHEDEISSVYGDVKVGSIEFSEGAPCDDDNASRSRSSTDPKPSNSGKNADAVPRMTANIENTNREVGSVSASSRSLKRTTSMVRLSTSLDGKASVILKGETPSPPSKPKALMNQMRPSLQRSQSSISTGTKVPSVFSDTNDGTLPPRAHGRSRDVRSWEFYCDPEARDSLTKTAEDDQRGSAAGPIQLIRSSSAAGRQALASSNSKQNLQMRMQGSAKRKTLDDLEKPRQKLARTVSSSARLQSTDKLRFNRSESLKGGTNTQHELSKEPSGDSDKENWEPSTQRHFSRPRPSTASASRGTNSRKILQENRDALSYSSSLGAMMEREALGGRAKGFHELEQKLRERSLQVDAEISEFMGSSSTEEENKGEELDAVQNLLSLSQGAWA